MANGACLKSQGDPSTAWVTGNRGTCASSLYQGSLRSSVSGPGFRSSICTRSIAPYRYKFCSAWIQQIVCLLVVKKKFSVECKSWAAPTKRLLVGSPIAPGSCDYQRSSWSGPVGASRTQEQPISFGHPEVLLEGRSHSLCHTVEQEAMLSFRASLIIRNKITSADQDL